MFLSVGRLARIFGCDLLRGCVENPDGAGSGLGIEVVSGEVWVPHIYRRFVPVDVGSFDVGPIVAIGSNTRPSRRPTVQGDSISTAPINPVA